MPDEASPRTTRETASREAASRQVRPGFSLPDGELRWRFSRSSGPGGQGVNTADSRVELRFDLARSPAVPEQLRARALARLDGRLVDGVLVVTASEQRAQLRNREAALGRLVDLLREATAPPPRSRRPTKPSRGSVERRLAAKRQRADTKRTRRAGNPDSD
ncbi:alternative ribosome rescue aminoacyl-tRNA hydrolase ArfB [Pseudofrankia sp. DC12]|uniref:alternative ribosome rescue aminoacyl-tRNA hydrolase ArfB n=1 Tax=Pseudofrankia sp. DC12 TaxID=683315 RepID=UPI0009FD7B9E|nr:alternative ribosome rescue aminoacyl-tRNA hydrolase ArfB [Pseudofrankia sp. DC12]